MNLSLRRITSSGRFIPEVDGLRFIAISSVVIYHLSGFLVSKDTTVYTDTTNYDFLKLYIFHGHLGIPLFFIISGFILGIPFANHYLLKEKAVSIPKYFLRRVTRLEPPYIICMTVLLIGAVYVAETVSFRTGIGSYFSSLIYAHNFLYPVLPLLNGSAWSLEVEIQFYILAPLIAFVYKIGPVVKRRTVLVTAIFLFITFNSFVHLPVRSFINYFHYFLMGFLLSDFYVLKHRILPKTKFDFVIALVLFVVMWTYDRNNFQYDYQKYAWTLLQLSSVFFFYYYVLFHKAVKLLSMRAVTNTGGMCYSIYLLHYPIISLFGNPLLEHSFSSYTFLNITLYVVLLLLAVWVLSAAYFILVERPCMETHWYRRFFPARMRRLYRKS